MILNRVKQSRVKVTDETQWISLRLVIAFYFSSYIVSFIYRHVAFAASFMCTFCYLQMDKANIQKKKDEEKVYFPKAVKSFMLILSQ